MCDWGRAKTSEVDTSPTQNMPFQYAFILVWGKHCAIESTTIYMYMYGLHLNGVHFVSIHKGFRQHLIIHNS